MAFETGGVVTRERHLPSRVRAEVVPPALSRRHVLYGSGLSVIVGLVGCLGDAPVRSTPADEEAERRAIDAEESYLVERFENASCLTGWGLSETTAQTTATVSERTAEGVVVDVTHAYWLSTEELSADGASEARYLVTAEDARRIDGDSISPC